MTEICKSPICARSIIIVLELLQMEVTAKIATPIHGVTTTTNGLPCLERSDWSCAGTSFSSWPPTSLLCQHGWNFTSPILNAAMLADIGNNYNLHRCVVYSPLRYSALLWSAAGQQLYNKWHAEMHHLWYNRQPIRYEWFSLPNNLDWQWCISAL